MEKKDQQKRVLLYVVFLIETLHLNRECGKIEHMAGNINDDEIMVELGRIGMEV